MLTDKFYKRISSKTISLDQGIEHVYIAYKSVHGNPLVLFSEFESMPLFSIETQYSDKNMYKDQMTLSTEFETKHQCVLTKDNTDIEFIVTNLTEHCLHFSIGQNDSCMPINHINILKPWETIGVKSDKSNDRILKFITNNLDGEKVTLREKVSEGKLTDTDLSITVNPTSKGKDQDLDINHLKKLFEKTTWKSVDQFVLKQTIKKTMSEKAQTRPSIVPGITQRITESPWSQGSIEPDMNMRLFARDENVSENRESNFEDVYPEHAEDPEHDEAEGQYNVSDYLPTNQKSDWFDQINNVNPRNDHLINIYRPIGVNTIGSTHKNVSYDMRTAPLCPKYVAVNWNDIPNPTMRNIHDSLDRIGIVQGEKQQYQGINWDDIPDPTKRNIYERSDRAGHLRVNHYDMAQSYCGKVTHSDLKYKPETYKVDINVLYDVIARTHFGLVLLRGNYQVKNDDNTNAMCDELIDEYVNQTYIPLISKVYKTDECVCCLENSTNTLFYTCGHSCVCVECSKNINRCPMCQNGITVTLTQRVTLKATDNQFEPMIMNNQTVSVCC